MVSVLISLSRYIFWRRDPKTEAVSVCRAISENDNISCISTLHAYPHCVNTPVGPEGYTPFLIACLYGNTQVAKHMIKLGADINKKTNFDESAFYLATFCNVKDYFDRNVSCLAMLYDAGADIDAPTKKGLTALQMAAMFGKTNLVKWLLKKGAKSSVSPHPYILARSQGFQSTADTILEWEQTKALQHAIGNPSLALTE